jgi:glutamyl-tRNA synthetase
MSVIVRFAPSPTGYLHIGGARTALFNWLFARHHGGKFLLRIEDTDRARSTQAAIEAIFAGLHWLELDWDGDVVMQFARMQRHQEVAHELVRQGLAYHCYCSPEELAAMKEQAQAEGRPPRYNGLWRDRDPAEAPAGAKPVVRLKAPQTGETVIDDMVQGTVRVANSQLDDMILLRADGTPTYMLSVVVDDHDMGITHIIRGDDHLTNAFRQTHLYQAMGWSVPQFAHIPLIHGADGAKLSKRHGALGVEAYRDMGFLPAAMRNYLLRLGWSHGDEEIISTDQAIAWFDVDHIGRSPSRFDVHKLSNLNGHYIRQTDDAALVELILPHIQPHTTLDAALLQQRLTTAMPGLKTRASTLVELAESTHFLMSTGRPTPDPKAQSLLTENKVLLQEVRHILQSVSSWDVDALETSIKDYCAQHALKVGQVAQPLRAALTGRTVSPGIYEVMIALGREESLIRLS